MNWILLEESKPAIGDHVLISVEPSRPLSPLPYEIFAALVVEKDGDIAFKDKWGFCELFKMKVHFWMPIPKPPYASE